MSTDIIFLGIKSKMNLGTNSVMDSGMTSRMDSGMDSEVRSGMNSGSRVTSWRMCSELIQLGFKGALFHIHYGFKMGSCISPPWLRPSELDSIVLPQALVLT